MSCTPLTDNGAEWVAFLNALATQMVVMFNGAFVDFRGVKNNQTYDVESGLNMKGY